MRYMRKKNNKDQQQDLHILEGLQGTFKHIKKNLTCGKLNPQAQGPLSQRLKCLDA